MPHDPFQDLLNIEEEFYQEGYAAGVEDSAYAGRIEGKVFGIEKGYEKALELGRLHGKASVWQCQLNRDQNQRNDVDTDAAQPTLHTLVREVRQDLRRFPSNARLQKHVDLLMSSTNGRGLSPENSDDAVAQFEDQVNKARARAKIIANTVGEEAGPVTSTSGSIEDATGLVARS